MEFKVKVGEEVGIARYHRSCGTILTSRFGTVTKVNGHGHIYVQSDDREFVFNKRGDAYKDDYGPSLTNATALRAHLAADERRKEQVRAAREMEQTLKEGYAYSGRFFATAERIAKLKETLAELEKLVDA